MKDYKNLFDKSDILYNNNFHCIFHRPGGEISFRNDIECPMIFILSGCLKINFTYTTEIIHKGFMTIINSTKLQKVICEPETILLQYTPIKKISEYFNLCCKTFHKECTTPVPIREELSEWIDTLLTKMTPENTTDENIQFQNIRELARIIMNYPLSVSGEIYVPFYVCNRISFKEYRYEGT